MNHHAMTHAYRTAPNVAVINRTLPLPQLTRLFGAVDSEDFVRFFPSTLLVSSVLFPMKFLYPKACYIGSAYQFF